MLQCSGRAGDSVGAVLVVVVVANFLLLSDHLYGTRWQQTTQTHNKRNCSLNFIWRFLCATQRGNVGGRLISNLWVIDCECFLGQTHTHICMYIYSPVLFGVVNQRQPQPASPHLAPTRANGQVALLWRLLPAHKFN